MSNAFASALEISVKIVRDNVTDRTTARRSVTQRLHSIEQSAATDERENGYLLNLTEGFRAALIGLHER